MREFDEAHVSRLLRAEVAEYGSYSKAAKAWGVNARTLWGMAKGQSILSDRFAQLVGYRRKLGGILSGAHRPLKFVLLDDGPNTTGERK